MKRFLYGTTALAAVGLAAGPVLAAEPLHMELGGYYQQVFGWVDTDTITGGATTNKGDFGNYQNAEVYFKMRGELDNGLKIGGRIELEGENAGDQIDQAYLSLAGGFGQLRIGAINSVAMSAFFWSLTYLAASMSSMILALSPLVVLSLLALRGERGVCGG